MDFIQVHEARESVFVSQWDKVDAMVNECRETIDYSRLLSTTGRPGGDERAREFAVEGTGTPELTGRVPEGFPLRGEVAITGGYAKEEGVIIGELGHLKNGVGGLGRCVHLVEDFLWEGLANSGGMLVVQRLPGSVNLLENRDLASSFFYALLLGLGDWIKVSARCG
jgi:hypothetical protein